MKQNFLILLCLFAFEKISADYVGPKNGNGNAYGVPSDSFKPPPSGPYPPSGWKPAGRRLVLPGESRNGYHPIGTDYGQPPPSQYGPSIDNTFPPNNYYIPGNSVSGPSGNGNDYNGNGHNGNGNGFANGNGNGHGNGHKGNGFSNGNGHNGNGGNGISLPTGNGFATGNGHNGNGQNGNGHGNGHNGNGHNGNGHNGNGFPTGNGHNGNGFPTGNGHNGNGFPTGNGHNGNGFPTGNGHNGNGFPTGNGHNGNGFSTGNGHNGNGNNKNGISNGGNGLNGHNGDGGTQNGNGVSGSNGKIPTFLTSGPGQIYPFIQLSVPSTIAAIRPGLNLGAGNIYPIFHVPSHSHQHPNIGIFTSLDPGTALTYGSGLPTTATASTVSDLSNIFHISQGNSQNLKAALPTSFSHTGEQIIGNGIGHYYSNSLLQKSNLLAAKNGLNSLGLQYTLAHPFHGNLGVPLSV